MEDLKLAIEKLISLENEQNQLLALIKENYPEYDFEFLQDLIDSCLSEFTSLNEQMTGEETTEEPMES